jgi:hypothetical protein
MSQALVKVTPPTEYFCQMAQENYCGLCPVTACPANIAASGRTGGCIFVFLNGKRELTHHELSYVTGLSLKETKRQLNIGETAIANVLLLNNILTRLRDHNRLTCCPNCGILRNNKLNCANKLKCQQRQTRVEKIRRKSPLNIPELAITNQDIFLLLNNQANVVKFLEEARPNTTPPLTLASLLNISRDKMQLLSKLRTRA